MIRVERYTSAWKSHWDTVVRRAHNGHFMFERDFMEYHADRFDDHSLLFLDDDTPMAVLPAHRKGEDLISHQGLPFAGLVWVDAVRMSAMSNVVQILIDHLKANGLARLIYTPVPAPYKRFHDDGDVYQLERVGALLRETKVSCAVRVGTSPGIATTRGKHMRRAQRNGLQIDPKLDMARAYEMISTFLEKKSYRPPVHTLDELQLLARRFPDQIHVHGIFKEDSLLHSIISFHSESCIRLQYMGGTEQGREHYAPDFFYALLFQDPVNQGRWIDFGTSMDLATGELDPELHWYKESFGGRSSLVRTFVLNLREV